MKNKLLIILISLIGSSAHAQNTLLPAGNVGIGISDPTEVLTLRDPRIPYDSSSGTLKIRFDSGSGGGGLGFEKETYNTGGLRFYTQYGYNSMLEKMRITAEGNVGIGTISPDATLTVNGNIHTKEVLVDVNVWPDYVFKPNYELKPLSDVKTYIEKHHHLPEMRSEREMIKKGLQLGEVTQLLVKKIEELTLYLISQKEEEDKHNKIHQQEINELKNKISELQNSQANKTSKPISNPTSKPTASSHLSSL